MIITRTNIKIWVKLDLGIDAMRVGDYNPGARNGHRDGAYCSLVISGGSNQNARTAPIAIL